MTFFKQEHDPGGKTLPMLPGVRGDAKFHGSDNCFRTELRRWWGSNVGFAANNHALWIGMNPSTARGDVDDPTIRREIFFSERFHVTSYKKCNVMDYRATNPKDLLVRGVIPCSSTNIRVIEQALVDARYVIVAWGKVNWKLDQYVEAVAEVIKKHSVRCFCLGLTNEGHPRHPLYVDGTTLFQPWYPYDPNPRP